MIAETCSRSPVKTMNPAYNKNCRGDDLFSVASKLCFVQVLEVWILRHSKNVFRYVQVPFKAVFTVYIFNLHTAAFKAYCAIWVRSSNFRHQASPACHHARAPSGGRWNCGREMSEKNFA